MNADTKCQWLVEVVEQGRSHRCYWNSATEVEGRRLCRNHAKALIRTLAKPGPERDAMLAAIPSRYSAGDPDGLTRSQRAVLNVLLDAAPMAVATDDICRRAFGREPILDDRQAVRAHVCGLRARLGFARIENVRGFGYQVAAGRERKAS